LIIPKLKYTKEIGFWRDLPGSGRLGRQVFLPQASPWENPGRSLPSRIQFGSTFRPRRDRPAKAPGLNRAYVFNNAEKQSRSNYHCSSGKRRYINRKIKYEM